MFKRKITRKEFLKTVFVGILAILGAPLLRLFRTGESISYKEARYYKNLAG